MILISVQARISFSWFLFKKYYFRTYYFFRKKTFDHGAHRLFFNGLCLRAKLKYMTLISPEKNTSSLCKGKALFLSLNENAPRVLRHPSNRYQKPKKKPKYTHAEGEICESTSHAACDDRPADGGEDEVDDVLHAVEGLLREVPRAVRASDALRLADDIVPHYLRGKSNISIADSWILFMVSIAVRKKGCGKGRCIIRFRES